MKLFFQRYGTSGPPVIILHGLLGMLDNWHSISNRLSQSFSVIAVDLRNHGRSPHSEELDYRIMAQDVRDLMDTLSIPAASIIGHSMGGKVAMQFVSMFPGRCTKLVVVDIAPRAYGDLHTPVFEAMASVDLKALRSRNDADTLLAKRISDPAMRQFLLKNLTRRDDGTFAWKPDIAVLRSQYPHLCSAIQESPASRLPALFIRGALSDHVTDDDLPLIGALFPDFQLVTIPGAGHWVHADAPALFMDTVVQFLAA